MDTSDGPGNAIKGMEDFINEQYPGDPQYVHNQKMCRLPLGHRIRIKTFLELVKEKNKEPKTKVIFRSEQSRGKKYTAGEDSLAGEQLDDDN